MFYFATFLGIINTRIYKTNKSLFFLKKNFSLISKLFLNPVRINKMKNQGKMETRKNFTFDIE